MRLSQDSASPSPTEVVPTTPALPAPAEPAPPPSSPEKPKLFRADLPPSDLEQGRDAFGHKAYATALASALLEAEAPFTCGLFGPFGLGKTTVIDELKRQLNGKAAVVVFDAWRYEDDELRRQFLRETAAELQLAKELPSNWTEKHLADLDSTTMRDKPEGLLGFSRHEAVRILLHLGAAALLIWAAWRFGPSFGSGAKKEIAKVISAVFIAVGTFLVAGLGRVFYVPTKTVTTGELKPELFSAKFSNMIGDLKKSTRLVVVIDNLDRCSAARIEQIFFTLSTFLEPLSVEKNTKRIPIGEDRATKTAVFVIAADDHALRTHLDAQEAAASGNTPSPSRSDVGKYSDEYLRKIFKASIRMKQILADDMRDYVGEALDDFCLARELSAEGRATLVQLVSAALRYNPRRIKEFGNNLELMLRVIEAREIGSQPQIVPPISQDVLLVAKVRLLEEEWLDKYNELYADPRVLARWYEQMEAYGALQGGSEARLNAFMNVARSIPDRNLRALLRLKQSWDEVRLPRSVEFHEALVEGQAEIVNEIVTTEGADPKAYAARLAPILSEELSRLYYAGARNLIEVALAIEPLRSQTEEMKRLMLAAADDRGLRLELRNSPPEAMFKASDLLDPIRFNQLMEPWVELDTLFADSPERAAQGAEALLPRLDRLSTARRERLCEGLGTDPLRASISTYLPLLEAAPVLTPESLGQFAADLLAQRFDTSSDAFRLFRAWLGRPALLQQPQDEVAALIGTEIAVNVVADGSFNLTDEQLRTLAETVSSFRTLADPDALQTSCLNAFPAALAADRGYALLAVLDSTLNWETSIADQTAAQAVALYADHDLDGLMDYVDDPDIALSETLAKAIEIRLQAVTLDASYETDLRLRAAETIAMIDPGDDRELIGSMPYQLLNVGDWGMASLLLDRHKSIGTMEKYETDNVDSALKRATAESPDISAQAFDFIEKTLRTYEVSDLDQLRDLLDQVITDGDAQQAKRTMEAVDRFGKRDRRFRSRREQLLRETFDSIAATEVPPYPAPVLVAQRAKSLDADRRASFVAQLERWIGYPGPHQPEVAEAAAALEEPETDERTELVSALIKAETAAAGNIDLRLALLEAANKLRGWRTSNASKRLRDRLKAIKSQGGEENDELLKRLSFS